MNTNVQCEFQFVGGNHKEDNFNVKNNAKESDSIAPESQQKTTADNRLASNQWNEKESGTI